MKACCSTEGNAEIFGHRVVLVGNPNSGKSLIFNALTGSDQKVANFPGVTVQARSGALKIQDHPIELVDLPGVYSFLGTSKDAVVTRDFVRQNPDAVFVNIIDSTRLRRSLLLTLQLLNFTKNVLVVLNFSDRLESIGGVINKEEFSRILGVPVVHTSALRRVGIDALRDALVNFQPDQTLVPDIPQALDFSKVTGEKMLEVIDRLYNQIEEVLPSGTAEIERRVLSADGGRYEWVDNILLQSSVGIPVFAAFMWLIFWLTFEVGGMFSDIIDAGFATASATILELIPNEFVGSLLADGLLAGLGFILVFVPQLLILFLLIGLMEQSGYLTRVVYITDRMLARAGITGRSIAPILLGFGCNVPAILSTRTIENAAERKVTAFSIPFISCSARFPVLILLGQVVYPPHPELVVTLSYFLSIFVSLMTMVGLRKLVYKGERAILVMEMPEFQLPSLSSLLSTTFSQIKAFVIGIGKGMGAGVVLVWFLSVFGPEGYLGRESLENPVIFEKSWTFLLGGLLRPVFAPMGWDERVIVALIFGFIAKELVVGILGILYGGSSGSIVPLVATQLSPLSAVALMVFVLLYVPCLGTVFAQKKEFGSRFAISSMVYSLLLAYILAAVIVMGGGLV